MGVETHLLQHHLAGPVVIALPYLNPVFFAPIYWPQVHAYERKHPTANNTVRSAQRSTVGALC